MQAETFTHTLIYVFSFLGLAWVPVSLGKLKWVFPIWFLVTNLIVFSSLWMVNINGKPWIFLALNQMGWVFITAWFLSIARKSQDYFAPGEWTRWQIFRLMNGHVIFLAYAYTLPMEHILKASLLESVVALSAWPLALWLRRGTAFAHLFWLGWNILGFISLWQLNLDFSTYLLESPQSMGAKEIISYYQGFPQIWIPSFWIPVGLTAHVIMLTHHLKTWARHKK